MRICMKQLLVLLWYQLHTASLALGVVYIGLSMCGVQLRHERSYKSMPKAKNT